MILVNILVTELTKDTFVELEWRRTFNLLREETRTEFWKWSTLHRKFGLFGYSCGIFPAICFDRPYVAYSIVALKIMMDFVNSIWGDRVMWRVTIGNRINSDTADKILTLVRSSASNLDVMSWKGNIAKWTLSEL